MAICEELKTLVPLNIGVGLLVFLQQSFNPALEPSTLTFGKGENIGNLQLQILNLQQDPARC